jgi:hypothetical protein
MKGYAFPPFSLIKDCLYKIRKEKSEWVLICPLWPGQPWFPLLLELASDIPLILPQCDQLLTTVWNESHPLVAAKTLWLTAWKLSGDDSVNKAFREMWSTYWWQDCAIPQMLHISRPGQLGLIGATNGVQIPCLPLWQ